MLRGIQLRLRDLQCILRLRNGRSNKPVRVDLRRIQRVLVSIDTSLSLVDRVLQRHRIQLRQHLPLVDPLSHLNIDSIDLARPRRHQVIRRGTL